VEEEDPEAYFMRYDLDGDHALSPSEFLKMRGGVMGAEDAKFFREADTSGNSLLEYGELESAFLPMLHAQVAHCHAQLIPRT
jgi:hypothetical protein